MYQKLRINVSYFLIIIYNKINNFIYLNIELEKKDKVEELEG